jgi:hypothetical protein
LCEGIGAAGGWDETYFYPFFACIGATNDDVCFAVPPS